MKIRTKRDWVSMVLNDLEKLDMKHLTMENITNMKKGTFSDMVRKKI